MYYIPSKLIRQKKIISYTDITKARIINYSQVFNWDTIIHFSCPKIYSSYYN